MRDLPRGWLRAMVRRLGLEGLEPGPGRLRDLLSLRGYFREILRAVATLAGLRATAAMIRRHEEGG